MHENVIKNSGWNYDTETTNKTVQYLRTVTKMVVAADKKYEVERMKIQIMWTTREQGKSIRDGEMCTDYTEITA